MRINFKYTMGLVVGASLALTACQNDFDDPGLKIPEATLQSNISIADFKKLSWDENAMQLTDDNDMGDYIIKGRVISSDASGNIYQSLVIQDETAALPISIKRASLFNEYHLGQEILIDTRGLWLGKYNSLIQLGWLGEYKGEDQITFMSFPEFQYHSQLNGLPDPTTTYIMPGEEKPADGIYCLVLDIDNLPQSGEEMYNLQGQLVEFRNVSFEGGGKETFAHYQENNVKRFIKADGGNLKLTVNNSGYATFYNNILPEGTGTVRGILSWYPNETDNVVSNWQLLLRSLDDLDFTSKGDEEDPYTIAEAREIVGKGYNGWVSGYVIGSVKSSVEALTSADDIIFGADAELKNNLVIAATPDTRNLEDMMVVNLPQNTTLRSFCNLVDNPSVLGRVLNVRGEFTEFLGFAAVAGSGEEDSFKLDASGEEEGPVVPGGGPVEDGDGSKESPFSVNQVIASNSNSVDVWVEGYVVGYVDANVWNGTNAKFGNTPSTSANYIDGSNLILSNVPVGEANLSNSVPVGLTTAVRPNLAISKNSAIYGKRVKVKGTVAKNMEARGVKNVIDYEILN